MNHRLRYFLRRSGKYASSFLVISSFCLLFLEIIYRYQFIDFYSTELHYLNPKQDNENGGKNVLIFGDSFSALDGSWVEEVRSSFPDRNFINSSVPGTGMFQAHYMAKNRVNTFKPDIVIFQLYTGNDLLDINFPVNWSNNRFLRNIYWSLGQNLRALTWLNYRFGQWFKNEDLKDGKEIETGFSPGKYSNREKIWLKADPNLIDNSVNLKNGREEDMVKLLSHLNAIIELCGDECQPVLVVIPHCSQVNNVYFERMKMIGAEFNDQPDFEKNDYPFIEKLKKETRAKVLNPIGFFRARENAGIKMYYENDPHLNGNGQQELGKWMAEELKKIPGI